MRDGIYLVLLFAILPGPGGCQQSGARYEATGTVVNLATGEPIKRALVMAGEESVFTGGDGHFKIENLPEGWVMLAAQKPGYFECATRYCEGGGLGHANLMVHSNLTDVVLKLAPESFIEGRITDENGDPVSNLQVSARCEVMSEGTRQFAQSGGATTDENGNYRIEGLWGGKYTVETMARPEFEFGSPGLGGAPFEMYPRLFYPNTPDAGAAQLLDLKPGQTARADFAMKTAPGIKIAGTVGPHFPWVSMVIEDESGEETSMNSQFNPQTGRFLLTVPAGTWTIHFGTNTSEGKAFTASVTVTAGSQNIDNLNVALEPVASVPLKVVGDTGGEEQPPVNVSLVARGKSRRGGFFGGGRFGKFSQNGLEIADVSPGKYSVRVSAPNRCIDSVTSGSLDLTQNDLEILSGSQTAPISVVLRSDCASLEATLPAESRTRLTYVVLVPASRAAGPQFVELSGGTNTMFSSLSPGEYQVYAFTSIDGLEYANPEAMREYSGQQVTLAANQKASVALKVITRGEEQ
ncbi:MAG: carboxypeptidase regulatory-like domain-containing protein [Acidobacteriaceae bacterium]|nr:carboxypeptidase regulatory-like domain-containing protein [Acidobacteriaceae bacterium]